MQCFTKKLGQIILFKKKHTINDHLTKYRWFEICKVMFQNLQSQVLIMFLYYLKQF